MFATERQTAVINRWHAIELQAACVNQGRVQGNGDGSYGLFLSLAALVNLTNRSEIKKKH